MGLLYSCSFPQVWDGQSSFVPWKWQMLEQSFKVPLWKVFFAAAFQWSWLLDPSAATRMERFQLRLAVSKLQLAVTIGYWLLSRYRISLRTDGWSDCLTTGPWDSEDLTLRALEEYHGRGRGLDQRKASKKQLPFFRTGASCSIRDLFAFFLVRESWEFPVGKPRRRLGSGHSVFQDKQMSVNNELSKGDN